MDKQLFRDRFFDWWTYFNPGRSIPPGLKAVGDKYYDHLVEEKINYQDFARVCDAIEHDFAELPYSFNLAAYVLDCVRLKRQEQVIQEEAEQVLSRVSFPPVDGSFASECIKRLSPELEKLKGNNEPMNASKLFEIISHINQIACWPTHSTVQCAACNDSGFVYIPSIKRVKRCVCPRGQRIWAGVKQATNDECQAASVAK